MKTSLVVEAALAGLFAAAAVVPAVAADSPAPMKDGGTTQTPAKTPAKSSGKVHCYGVNKCSGKSECATDKSSCKHKNACKGQGWISLSAKTCKKRKGTTEAPKAPAAAPAAAPAKS